MLVAQLVDRREARIDERTAYYDLPTGLEVETCDRHHSSTVVEGGKLGPCQVPCLPGVPGSQQDPAVPLDLHRLRADAQTADPVEEVGDLRGHEEPVARDQLGDPVQLC